MTITNFKLGSSISDINSQLSNSPDELPLLITRFFEEIGLEEGTFKIGTRDVSGDGAWGKGFNDSGNTVNNLNWGASTAVWDADYANSPSYTYILNPSGYFNEHFVDDEFIDTGTSDCTISLGENGSIDFTDGEILQSEIINKTGATLSKATLYVNDSVITGDIDWYLQVDGSNWEAVTVGEEHTFTNAGSTGLKYKAVADGVVSIDTKYTTNNSIIKIKVS